MSTRSEPKERGFFRSIVSSIGNSSNGLRGTQSSTSTSSAGSPVSEQQHRPLAKNHSFSGNLPFNRSSQEEHANGTHQSILSKRPSLILPFNSTTNQSSNHNSSHSANHHSTNHSYNNNNNSTDQHEPIGQHYLDDFQAPIAKSGVLIKQANHFKTWKKRLMVLKGHSLFYYVSGTSGEDTYPRGVIPLLGVKITPIDMARFKRQNCFEICHPGYRPVYLMAKSEADLNVWMSSLTSAAMATTPDRKMLLVSEPVDPLFDTPALEDAVPYKRTFYFRQKIAFAMPRKSDRLRSPADLFELNEKRLTTLCDLNSYCDAFPMILADPQLYTELLVAIGAYIFRPFATVTSNSPPNVFVDEPSAEDAAAANSSASISSLNGMNENPLDKYSEYTPEEQHWGLLSACYDLLLKAIEHIDKLEKAARKDFFSLRFVAQLVNLFQTPSFRERQVLKGVLHRLYYKLTQRRAAIRKEVAHAFYAYIYETQTHFGVAELLEILGSIVNGFACPIKREHVVLLEKALVPLHASPAFVAYHQQLAYCMLQYVAKDHALFTPVVRGLLKYWPVGNSFKEVVFIVELEELLEHVLADSDVASIAPLLAKRLGQCMVSDQFQVAERAIACWSSPACLRIMNAYEQLAQRMFDILRPFLQRAAATHWNPLIQQKALETYTLYYNMGYGSDETVDSSVVQTSASVGGSGGSGDADVVMLEVAAAATALPDTMTVLDDRDRDDDVTMDAGATEVTEAIAPTSDDAVSVTNATADATMEATPASASGSSATASESTATTETTELERNGDTDDDEDTFAED